MRAPWIVGVSGASGTPYARAVIGGLLDASEPVDLVISRAARLTLLDETGGTVRDAHWKDDVAAWLGRELDDLLYWPVADLAAGAVVLPASPGFYGAGAQATAAQLIDFVAGKVLDAIGVPHTLFTRWTGELSAQRSPLGGP
jgi:3-polyprenyl-4-hydroxybenzoate decarboxylase